MSSRGVFRKITNKLGSMPQCAPRESIVPLMSRPTMILLLRKFVIFLGVLVVGKRFTKKYIFLKTVEEPRIAFADNVHGRKLYTRSEHGSLF